MLLKLKSKKERRGRRKYRPQGKAAMDNPLQQWTSGSSKERACIRERSTRDDKGKK